MDYAKLQQGGENVLLTNKGALYVDKGFRLPIFEDDIPEIVEDGCMRFKANKVEVYSNGSWQPQQSELPLIAFQIVDNDLIFSTNMPDQIQFRITEEGDLVYSQI